MRQAPSLARRAIVAVAVLVAFYATVAAIALALLPIPVFVFMAMNSAGRVQVVALLAVVACSWIPSGLLLSGLFGVKPPPFSEPGLPLRREDAPALFAMLDELAASARTKAPDAVYVSATPELFVGETGGGFLGTNSKRILCVGAPLLVTSSVAEVRAMLAHELGHYVGGDTRLSGVLAYTIGAFRSVLEATERNAFHDAGHWMLELAHSFAGGLAKLLVKLYAGIYLRLTRPLSRRQELAADALSAELAGREAAIRALEHAHLLDPLYSLYLTSEVAFAIDNGAMPTDLLSGFARFREVFVARGDVAALERAVREAKTDPFDTHPALADRVAALHALVLPEARADVVDANARTLLDGPFDVDTWLVDATFTSYERTDSNPIARLPWAEIMSTLVPARVERRAKEIAALLFSTMPHATTVSSMFTSTLAAFETGHMNDVAAVVEPRLHEVPPHLRQDVMMQVGTMTLSVLLEGALLERGATLRESLGEPCVVFDLGGEVLRPALVARRSMTDEADRRELSRIASLLASPAESGPAATT